MEKILTFIVNSNNELLLLLGNPKDPQFKKSIWYVITGGIEKNDVTREDAVVREIKEETGLNTHKTIYLNWVFKYNSLDIYCIEYAYITFVKDNKIVLKEESIDYKWCSLDEFIHKIDWFGDKTKLIKVLNKALNNELFFKKEEIDIF